MNDPVMLPEDLERLRRIHRALVLHYVEGLSQAEIAKRLNVSHATVNRLVKEGHERGFVDISIKSPFQALLEMEQKMTALGKLDHAIVVPAISEQEDVNLKSVGKAVADYILTHLKDGDTICVSGGQGVNAVIEGLSPTRAYNVTVVPATGGVQGKHFTDVNHLAAQMASKLQGRSFQIHAPVFADSKRERDVLMSVQSVKEVLARARDAAIAVVGIGSVQSRKSTYLDLGPGATDKRADLARSGAAGELVAHLVDKQGKPSKYEMNDRVIGLSLNEFKAIPRSIGIAAGKHKVEPIASILRSQLLKVLATDEPTAARVISYLKGHVA